MFVEKRNGTLELVDFNKILSRIKYCNISFFLQH